MCGIGGVYLAPGQDLDRRGCLDSMLHIQRHRGPDAEGIWISKDGRLGLCHNRLAIVDLTEAGNQPMETIDGRYVIVFNGEIYNYREIRKDLEAEGTKFKSCSDTEVIVEAYRHWGEDMLHRLRGMFAFGIYDCLSGELFCARDRIGKKPFVYAETDYGFVFSSEIPAVLAAPGIDRSIDRDAIAGMLLHNMRHIADPHTGYRGVRRLKAGHAVRVKNGRIQKIWRYWQPQPARGAATPQRLRAILEDAVRLRSIADVPVGALLSGGIDSSAIVALMTQFSREPIRTYALGYDSTDEDLRRARIVADRLGCIHKEFYFDGERQWDVFRRLIDTYGEPIMLLPLVHAYELCESVRDDGIKVVLGGHGADELFCGYTGHVRTARLSTLLSLIGPVGTFVERLGGGEKEQDALSILRAQPGTRKAAYYRGREGKDWSLMLSPEARDAVTNVVAEELEYWGRLCPSKKFIDESNFCALMVENTHSVTISSDLPPMLASVEMRAPFLDQEMVSFALATPVSSKVPWIAPLKRLKWILRRAVQDLVPDELLHAPKRGFGFGIPQERVLRGAWRHYGDELFAAPHDADGLFDRNALQNSWERFQRHESVSADIIAKMLAIQYWLQTQG
ncbi:MAG: asparagine synthase (glutamine-hydrolyzing) [Nitrospirae bacterium]|nr:MAG: asparagine synthase (glutamine-hydrolyzing) [Nitrospirota bacterium]